MTLAAGALFGLLEGTILVSFASSLGASLAFYRPVIWPPTGCSSALAATWKRYTKGWLRTGRFIYSPCG